MPEHDPNKPHHWPRVNGHTWANLGRIVISFLCGALIAAFVFGGKTQQFTDLLNWKLDTDVRLKVVEKQSNNNEYDIKTETRDYAAMDVRIKKNEELTAKIDTIVYKVDNLTKAVEELKNQKR